ncbi:undecaprenyl-phosphate glucose phosphotransferase [candidate division KSB1 bacterium]|nr:undecaprenyl-phosphate glucose phosphotransferase [candidate division KSB1 bacterium]
MPKLLEKVLLLALDFFALSGAFLTWGWLRRELGFFAEADLLVFFSISLIVNLFWIFLLAFFGMYGPWYAKSRVDELISIFKSLSIGVFIIFLITIDLNSDLSAPPKLSRMFIVNYWVMLILFVSSARMIFRTAQRKLLTSGIGQRRTLIVGWGEKSWELSDAIQRLPALGHKVIGFLSENQQNRNDKTGYKNIPLLGSVEEIEQIVQDSSTQEVILALEGDKRKKVMDVVNQCNGLQVNFKIVPDLYDIVMGQARTNQIYGFPLIDILPHHMLQWEQKIKRLMDIIISSAILIAFFPFWLFISIAIRLDSKGPVFYKQERVGKDGKKFMIYKFRSMIHDAESKTGPKWAQRKDPRITRAGKIIRKPRLDEVPQFFNVLKGEMSLIGPRPERPYFVEKFKREIPFYARRLGVKPGITGWAQIKGEYDTSMDNVKTKLQYDLFYLENMSLRMDLKVIINTIYVMLLGKGH